MRLYPRTREALLHLGIYVALSVITVLPLRAADTAAELTGTVKDTSGAVISNATLSPGQYRHPADSESKGARKTVAMCSPNFPSALISSVCRQTNSTLRCRTESRLTSTSMAGSTSLWR